MSGFEIFSAITGLLQLTDATYKVIKNYKDLPTEFKEVGERLPIAQRTLSIVEAQAQNAQFDAETLAAIQPLLDGCQMKTKELQSIFDKVRKWEGKSIRHKYHKFLVSATGKGKQVEKLMMAVLKDVQTLAADRMFETATAVQMEELKKAIEDMAELEPDKPDRSGGSQNIHGNITGGKLFYQQGSGTIQAPDGDIVGRDKIVGMDIRPKKPKSSDDSDSSSG